jgi:polysaccharide pyruvyl transferase WcaK-like protein
MLPGLLMDCRIMKYSQAMGPFQEPLNRVLGKAILSRVTINVARGQQTRTHLHELGLRNVHVCADAAFTMHDASTSEAHQALQALDRFGGRCIIGISASAVVDTYCKKHGIDYAQAIAGFANRAIAAGYGIWLIAHAVQKSRKKSRTNDVGVCQRIHDLLQDKRYSDLVVQDHHPATLRAVIGACDFMVASRFHAMVSSLAKGVPTLVTSWSHKYTEVLKMFDLQEWAIGHERLSAQEIWDIFQKATAQEALIRAKIARHLPTVVASSHQNAVLAASLLER